MAPTRHPCSLQVGRHSEKPIPLQRQGRASRFRSHHRCLLRGCVRWAINYFSCGLPHRKYSNIILWRILNAYQQATQRLSDGWRSVFGSVAMAAVNTFFEKHSDIYNSDESRQEFAKSMLDMNRFAYRKADGNKKSVSQLINSLLYLLILCIIEIPRRVPRPPHYTGFFCSFHRDEGLKVASWPVPYQRRICVSTSPSASSGIGHCGSKYLLVFQVYIYSY